MVLEFTKMNGAGNDFVVIDARSKKVALTRQDIEDKFALCCRHGGWDEAKTEAALDLAKSLYDGRVDLKRLRN